MIDALLNTALFFTGCIAVVSALGGLILVTLLISDWIAQATSDNDNTKEDNDVYTK